ncbi:MAG: hypothetical protein LBU30_04445 [Candidatus Methanoplasma sp.]|jgi:peptidoglycan biosynthesis protein MviN/MurJ (putative lipid II flippase)|nr:hypothetical protein [Candidatus Methanoplasma sp.]
MANKTEQMTPAKIVILISGITISMLLAVSFRGSINHVLATVSAVTLVLMILIVRPNDGSWFKNWWGESRYVFVLGLATGLMPGAMIALSYNFGSNSPIIANIIMLAAGVILFVVCMNEQSHHRRRNAGR